MKMFSYFFVKFSSKMENDTAFEWQPCNTEALHSNVEINLEAIAVRLILRPDDCTGF